jgi:hypothetical protein
VMVTAEPGTPSIAKVDPCALIAVLVGIETPGVKKPAQRRAGLEKRNPPRLTPGGLVRGLGRQFVAHTE